MNVPRMRTKVSKLGVHVKCDNVSGTLSIFNLKLSDSVG